LISNREGISLERISYQSATQNANNWFSASNLSGNATPGRTNSQIQKLKSKTGRFFSTNQTTISPDNDGFEDFISINYQLPYSDYVATIQIYDQEGRYIKQLLNNELIGMEGFINWDGSDFNNQKSPIGKYVIFITAFSLEGKSVLKEKIPVILATRF
jgi:flagellar hook assembly protein FlgD